MEEIITKIQEIVAVYGMKVVGAILILVVGLLVAKLLKALLRKIMQKSQVDETLVSFVTSLAYVGMLVFIIIAALSKLEVKTASFVAVIAAASFAVGLALQGSLANFSAGVLMIIFKPFKDNFFTETINFPLHYITGN